MYSVFGFLIITMANHEVGFEEPKEEESSSSDDSFLGYSSSSSSDLDDLFIYLFVNDYFLDDSDIKIWYRGLQISDIKTSLLLLSYHFYIQIILLFFSLFLKKIYMRFNF